MVRPETKFCQGDLSRKTPSVAAFRHIIDLFWGYLESVDKLALTRERQVYTLRRWYPAAASG